MGCMEGSLIEIKAWAVYDKYEPFFKMVVFAETRGKAKLLMYHLDMNYDYCDIRAQRVPQIDKYWTEHKYEMDWENSQDRFALVKELGFCCGDDFFDPDDCKECSAKEICDQYKDYLRDEREEDNG